MSDPSKLRASTDRLLQQYHQAHAANDKILKEQIEKILKRLGVKIPKL